MNAERLLKLADFLDTLPPERFDYTEWVGDDWDGRSLRRLGCKTAACALGWATQIPEFKKFGLKLTGYGTVDYRGSKGPISAAAEFFDVGMADAADLFIPGDISSDRKKRLLASASAKDVAAHIRKFVKDNQVLKKTTKKTRKKQG